MEVSAHFYALAALPTGKLSPCFFPLNRAPHHEGILGNGGIGPLIL